MVEWLDTPVGLRFRAMQALLSIVVFVGVTFARKPPRRHGRSYATEPPPTAQEALDKPLSWFLRVEANLSGARPASAPGG